MAIYHLSAKLVSRSQGSSSVAASAYRAGEKLLDERTDITHDYTPRQHEVVYEAIRLPTGAPEKLADRATLWNTVEAREHRKDAQLARDINIALPRELSSEQHIALANDFIQSQFVDKGMIADVAIHRGHTLQVDQPHVHVLLTLRALTAEGFGQKVRAWNSVTLLKHWREAWAEHCNRHLALAGIDQTIDHRTLEAQGIALAAQNKIGPKAARDPLTQKMVEHARIARDNGERLFDDPGIALKALTAQQSTFTYQDVARLVHRHTEDAAQFERVFLKIQQHPELVVLGFDTHGRKRYTTKTLLACEERLVNHAKALHERDHHAVKARVQRAVLREQSLRPEQVAAFRHLMAKPSIGCLVGIAGSGKSYLLSAAREAWAQAGFQVMGASLAGIAAQNLQASSGIPSYTLANRLLCWQHGRDTLTSRHVLVVDEAGLLPSRQLAQVLQAVKQAHAKVVLVGDPAQLQAIEAGAAFRGVIERVGYAKLDTVYRQKALWQRAATERLSEHDTARALRAYRYRGCIQGAPTKADAVARLVEDWWDTGNTRPNSQQLLLGVTRADVERLNGAARGYWGKAGLLGESAAFTLSRGQRTLAVGEPVYCLRNDKGLGVKNGTAGIVMRVAAPTVDIAVSQGEGTRCVRIDTCDYDALDYGYATTVYKSQGMTVDASFILAAPFFDRHSTYVALSRHRDWAVIQYAHTDFAHTSAMIKCLSRERQKEFSLDYTDRRFFTPAVTLSPSKDVEDSIHAVAGRDKDRADWLGAFIAAMDIQIEQPSATQVSLVADLTAAKRQKAVTRLFAEQAPTPVENVLASAHRQQVAMQSLSEAPERLVKQFGKPLSWAMRDNEQGVYRGCVDFVGGRQLVVEQANRLVLAPFPSDERAVSHVNSLCDKPVVLACDARTGQWGMAYEIQAKQRARTVESLERRGAEKPLVDKPVLESTQARMQQEHQALAAQFGKPLSWALASGERGIYRGVCALRSGDVHLIEQAERVLLVSGQWSCLSAERECAVVLENVRAKRPWLIQGVASPSRDALTPALGREKTLEMQRDALPQLEKTKDREIEM